MNSSLTKLRESLSLSEFRTVQCCTSCEVSPAACVHHPHPPPQVGAGCLDGVSVLQGLKTFSSLFRFSVTDRISSSTSLNQYLTVTLPFFRIKERHLAGLKLIRAQDMSFCNPWRIHPHWSKLLPLLPAILTNF